MGRRVSVRGIPLEAKPEDEDLCAFKEKRAVPMDIVYGAVFFLDQRIELNRNITDVHEVMTLRRSYPVRFFWLSMRVFLLPNNLHIGSSSYGLCTKPSFGGPVCNTRKGEYNYIFTSRYLQYVGEPQVELGKPKSM